MAAQLCAIEQHCEYHGLTLAHVYEDDGVSAKTLKGRPGLTDALEVLANGEAAALVVAKLDRLARSVHDFAGLVRIAEREGWGIVALDLGVDMTTPTGGLLANVTAISGGVGSAGSSACAHPRPLPRGRRRGSNSAGPGASTPPLQIASGLVGPQVPP